LLVHINYHLRGEESDGDEEFVREFAERNGLEVEVVDYVKSKVKSQKSKVQSQNSKVKSLKLKGHKISNNLEERLRDFRYGIFEEIRKERQFDWIAVGHHQNDQGETFLMNLFRGAGIDGLSGMAVKDKKRKIIRPLLDFSKNELINYLQSIQQGWREDKSNQDLDLLRNKIRQQLIPLLQKEYSPQLLKQISRTARQLQDYKEVLRPLILENKEKVVNRGERGNVLVNVENFRKMSAGMQSLIFREIIKELKGDLKNITEANYLEFQKIINSRKGKNQVMQIGGLKFKKKGNEMEIV